MTKPISRREINQLQSDLASLHRELSAPNVEAKIAALDKQIDALTHNFDAVKEKWNEMKRAVKEGTLKSSDFDNAHPSSIMRKIADAMLVRKAS